jgi:epoxyqueuosine reductase QueG
MDDPEELITVCDKCLTASCWHGKFMCQQSDHAGTTQQTRRELIALGLEHPDYIHN